jgi:ribosomal protein L22
MMPQSSWGEIDHMQLRHKILLLELLNNTPEPPSTTTINKERRKSISATESDHALDFQREKELAEAFAFLAATTNDPRKIIAACVKEHIDKRRGLTIQLSVNRGELGYVKNGFEKMAKILEHAAQEGAASGTIIDPFNFTLTCISNFSSAFKGKCH